jgi:hypothetical protein
MDKQKNLGAKKNFLFASFGVLVSILFIYLLISNASSTSVNNIAPVTSDGYMHYGANVCTQVVKADGTRESAQCSDATSSPNFNAGLPKVLFNTGKNITRDALILAGTMVPVNNITICNSSNAGGSGCATPTSAGSETYSEFGAGCGLTYTGGSVTTNVQLTAGNWTVYKTYTSTCDNMTTNVTRIGNNSVYFAGNSFTTVTLQTSDQLTVNWTLYLL